jgi:ABC-2 type transport system permease protein
MTRALSSELFKLRTTRTSYAFVGTTLGLVLLATIPVCAFVQFNPGDDGPMAFLLFFLGGLVVQVFALLLGILAVTTEFRHGTITPTLLVVPKRVELTFAKLFAGLLVGLALGLVSTLLIMGIVLLFGSIRDFDTSGDKLSWLIGGTLTPALFAAFGVGLGALVRNQVGAIVGSLVYFFVLEPVIGGLFSLSDTLDNIMPKYSLGAVSNALSGVNPDNQNDQLLDQVPGGLLLTLYVTIFFVAGLILMQRRDVTA